MDLDAANAQCKQPDYCIPYQQEKCPTCYFCGVKGHFARDYRLKAQNNQLQDLHRPSINYKHHRVTIIRCQGDHQVVMAHSAHVGATITISVPLITGMSPQHCNI